MTNENQREKISKLAVMSKYTLAGMICSKDNEIARLKEMLAENEKNKTAVPVENKGDVSHILEVQKLHELIDTLKQGNRKLINTVAYQAMQLAGELNKNG